MGVFGRPDKPGLGLIPGGERHTGLLLPGMPGYSARSPHGGGSTSLASGQTYSNFEMSFKKFQGLREITLNNCNVEGGLYTIRTLAEGSKPNAKLIYMNNCRVANTTGALVLGPSIRATDCVFEESPDDLLKPHGGSADPEEKSIYTRCVFHRLGTQGSSSHGDASQITSGGWIDFIECVFYLPYPGSPGWVAQGSPPVGVSYRSNACVFAHLNSNSLTNIRLINCWLVGGNYTIYMGNHPSQWNGSSVHSGHQVHGCYFGEENARWADGRAGARHVLLSQNDTPDSVDLLDNVWESDNAPIEGWPVSGGSTPPPIPPTPPATNPGRKYILL